MYIKKLELLNFQVIREFNADFAGNVYFITGDNELGKSTLLKAIGALLTGQRDDVLRAGEKKGFAKMVVGDDGEEFDVSLSFTEANPRGTLTIKQKTTGMQTSNVSMLQKIFGYQDFDAVEFSRWSETAEGRRKQIAVVKSLLPEAARTRIDAIDAEVGSIKSERTGINRDVKTFGALVDSAKKTLTAEDIEKYKSPIDVAELMERQKTAVRLAEKAKAARAGLEQRTKQLAEAESEKERIRQRHDVLVQNAERLMDSIIAKAKTDFQEAVAAYNKEMNDALAELDANVKDWQERKKNAENWLEKYNAMDIGGENIAEDLEKANQHNAKYNAVVKYKEEKARFDAVVAQSQQMDAKIDSLLSERASLISKSSIPIDGLSFGEDGLTLNGIPFVPGKVSDSQIMEVAAKLIIASNPKVKVFRIARGESLGTKRLETIVDIARRNGFQGFIEQVTRGQNEMMVEEYTEK